MQANYVQRLRLNFSKVGPTRWIGHLDLARTLERALNRARIPLAFTQGYNRRPRMQFAAALPLGFTSECELADIWLMEKLDPTAAQEKMTARMAPGIVIHDVCEVPLSEPALQMLTDRAAYRVSLGEPVDWQRLVEGIEALLAAKTLIRERRGKSYDLRPLVHRLQLSPGEDDNPVLEMCLTLQPGAAGRPDEVLRALALDPLASRIHRTQITLAEAPLEA
jgi:radical SAM-linked protein